MSTVWKNLLSAKTTDKVTGNALANQIPGASDDPNGDNFIDQWKDAQDVTQYTSQSRMTDNGRASLEAVIASGQADAWLEVSEIWVTSEGANSYTIYDKDNKRGLVVSEPMPEHRDIIVGWGLSPYES